LATALVALDGVLKTETGDPIPEGIRLFRVLAEHYRVVLCSDDSKAQTEHWLKSNMILGYADIYDDTSFFEGQDLRERQVAVAKASGKVALFVDVDADRCAMALAEGIPVLMFATPKFLRTTRDVKPWQDLTDEIERQKLAIVNAKLGSNQKRWE